LFPPDERCDVSAIARWFGLVRDILAEARRQEITFLAASIAYYAFVSLLPMLLLGLVIATFVGGEEFATQVVTAASDVLSPSGQNQLREIILNREGRTGATVVGSLVLLWSALKMFRGLDEAFSRVYNVTKPEGFLETVRDALVVVAAIAFGVAAMVLASLALRVLPDIPFANILSTLALILALLPVFLPLYYVFPDVYVSLREALPGAVVATVGWTVLQVGFRIYVRDSGRFEAYGVLGGALVLVTWLYFGAILLLGGTVVNAVLAGRFEDEEEEGGKRYLQERRRRLQRTDGAGMTERTTDDAARPDAGEESTDDARAEPVPDVATLADEIDALNEDLLTFADEVEERTVEREDIENELKRYVRGRIRRGHARGWGPYLVLLYGTAMTLGAFYWLRGGWSILAMVVIWTSTLGVYVLMVLFGFGIGALGVPKRLLDRFRSGRS
jgi:YihY family inner membrane protein